jgi:hypothetical protein
MMGDNEKGWCWIIAKIPGGDYAFFADMNDWLDRPGMIKVKHPTQIVVSQTKGDVTYGLWGPAALQMVGGDTILLQTSTISMFATADQKLVDDLEQAWGLKKIQEARKPLVFPGNGM